MAEIRANIEHCASRPDVGFGCLDNLGFENSTTFDAADYNILRRVGRQIIAARWRIVELCALLANPSGVPLAELTAADPSGSAAQDGQLSERS